MLSDQRTAALVTPQAQINWLCVPRIDSPAIFAALLGGPEAGHFSIKPLGRRQLHRTHSDLPGGHSGPTNLVADAQRHRLPRLRRRPTPPGRRKNRSDPPHRRQRTSPSRVCARLDFGRVPTRIEIGAGCLEVIGAADLLILRSAGVDWLIEDHGVHQSAVAEIDLARGPVTLQLRYGPESTGPVSTGPVSTGPASTGPASPQPARPTEPERRELTARFWRDWADGLRLPEVEPEMVRRSALTLKALCYGPTGAILAAATTSLPEFIGGVRNWDYRYCWIRDAAMSASALTRLGSGNEATDLLGGTGSSGVIKNNDVNPNQLSPLYTVEGQPLPPEETLEELAGYADSRPVRVGNEACHQLQLDVFGPVAELIHQIAGADPALPVKYWRLLEDLVDAVEQRWMEPDQGMWEIRSAPRHHTHSKVMCWLTVDRAVRTGADIDGNERPDWGDLRERIRDDIMANSWNDEVAAFTTAYDGTDLDASVLAIGLCGLVEPHDPRFAATVAAVDSSLRHNETVYRYKHDDGISGAEGGFNLMTSWLIDAKILIGDLDGARSLFESYLALAGPTGLISEEVDPETGAGLGNHPQAYSHLGLINNACNLARTNQRTAGRSTRSG